MTTIVELVNSFDQKSKEYEEFLQDVMFINGDIPFDIEEVDIVQSAIITAVNTRLNQSNTRYNGLMILDKILLQCSKDVLLKYCILWISKATQVLESIHSSFQDLTLSCKIIGNLIIRSKDIPEIQKQISMLNVKQLITAISNLDSEKKCGAVYYLIAVLLHQYPEVCERFQATIRKIILIQIDSTDDSLVNASSKCYSLLVKATERSFKPPNTKPTYTGWLYNEALICNSLHVIMDELFSNLIELETVDVWDKLDLPSISEKNIVEYYFKQKQRFLNLCQYLSSMLCGCDKKNSVSPHDILRVVCRGLAIQPSNLKSRNSFKEQMLYIMLPKLHIALLTVLDAFINGFKEQLIPFGSTILQLFHQTLQWTEAVVENQTTISGNKPYKYVRISVYKCLSSWLTNTNTLSGIETIVDEIFLSILKDIIPERDRVLLTVQKTQNLSKRALKRLRDSQYENSAYLNSGAASKKESCLDKDICKEALIALQNIFFSGGALLKQAVFKTVQNTIIPLLYDSYMSCTECKFYKENAECRLELLKVLRALQMNPHPQTPPPTQYSLEIFEMALSDIDVRILQETKIALAELEKIVHPSAPSLQLTQVGEVQREYITGDQDDCHVAASENEAASNVESKLDEDEDTAPSLKKRLKITNIEVVKGLGESNDFSRVGRLSGSISKPSATMTEVPISTVDSSTNTVEIFKNTVEVSTNTAEDSMETISESNPEQRIEENNESKQLNAPLENIHDNENVEQSTSNELEESIEMAPSNECEESSKHVLPKEIEENPKPLPADKTVEEEEILRLFHDELKEN